MKKELSQHQLDEIKRAFELAKQTISLIYSRLDIADIPNTGIAYILDNIMMQERAVLKFIAGE